MEYSSAYSLASATSRDRPMHRDLSRQSSRGPFLPTGLNSAHRRSQRGTTDSFRDGSSHPLTTRVRHVEKAMDGLEGSELMPADISLATCIQTHHVPAALMCGSTLERTQRQFESFAALAVAQQLAAEKLVARFSLAV